MDRLPNKRKLVVLLGTNASGKSDLGIRLAQRFNMEIVSADSRQVYRGLDLGSGKITPEQAAQVNHHLIDVAEVTADYTLARYQSEAYRALDSILAAGKLPMLVGGTGLYISALVEGYQLVEVPPNPVLRRELEQLPVEVLAERLDKLNPAAARKIDRTNPRRLVRAVEIAAAGLSHDQARQRAPRYDCLQLGLTWPREILEQRIRTRLADRLERGMIEEVATLRANGVSDLRLERLGLEYRFISRYLRGEVGSISALREQLEISIRQFARAQMTWFKRDPRIHWLDCRGDFFQEACDCIQEWQGEA